MSEHVRALFPDHFLSSVSEYETELVHVWFGNYRNSKAVMLPNQRLLEDSEGGDGDVSTEETIFK